MNRNNGQKSWTETNTRISKSTVLALIPNSLNDLVQQQGYHY